MHVVIFRAKLRRAMTEKSSLEYVSVAKKMRQRAIEHFGCLDFVSMTESDQELAVSYWKNEAAILAWRQDPEHQHAQALGKKFWYDEFSVDVLSLERHYESSKLLNTEPDD